MITEEQKYISGIFRNLGFAFLAPFGSMVFQFLLLEKIFPVDKVLYCVLISFLSWFLFFIGYNTVKEKINDK